MSRHAPSDRQPERGVTLVEVLVVLVLVGVLASVVGVSIGQLGSRDLAGREADLLVARLNRAADDVVLTGAPMRMTWDEAEYSFAVQDRTGAWAAHPVPLLAATHSLPRGLLFEDRTGQIHLTRDLRLSDGSRLTLGLRENGELRAQVIFDGINAARFEGAP